MSEHAAAPSAAGAGARTWLLERRFVLGWWAASRAVVLASALALHWTRRPRGFFGPALFRHPLGVLWSWDGRWYRTVAEHGYLLVPGRQSDPAFFPLYPVLLRIAAATGVSANVAGLVLSNLALLVALACFYELGKTMLPEPDARRATILAAVFPLGFVFSMVYPESAVFAAFAGAGLAAARGRWRICAALAAAATLARPEGLLLALPIGMLALRRWPALSPQERGRAVAAVLAPPAALAAFVLYLGFALDDLSAWSRAQTAWGRSFRPDGIVHAFVRLGPSLHASPWLARDVAFFALYAALLAYAWRRGLPRGWIAAGALIVLAPLGSGSFESDARFGLLALPVYWSLALLTRRRGVEVALVGACLVLLAAGTATLPLTFP